MGFTFRPAVREGVGLLIGLSGGTGSGKTFSALRLAKGMAGEQRFAFIDTEAGRGKHYADQFAFDHGDLHPPFRPGAYLEAIAAADAAHYPVIVVDSMSHEWAGEGGILDWQEDELRRMAGDDWKRREACKMAAWIQPKTAHKQMVQRLLQIRAHLILCFRAEPKIEMTRNADGKMEIVEKKSLTGLHGWIPIAEKNLPYELTASFLLMADRPGVPLPIKLQEQHKPFVALDAPITEAVGVQLAAWAKGDPAPPLDVAAWLQRIEAATTKAALSSIGGQLKQLAATVPSAQRDTLRAAYEARLNVVAAASSSRGPKTKPVPASDIPFQSHR